MAKRRVAKKFEDLSFVFQPSNGNPRVAWLPTVAANDIITAVDGPADFTQHVSDIQYSAGYDIGHRAAVEFAQFIAQQAYDGSEEHDCELVAIINSMFDTRDPEWRFGPAIQDHWRRGEIEGFLYQLQVIFKHALEAKGNELLEDKRRKTKASKRSAVT